MRTYLVVFFSVLTALNTSYGADSLLLPESWKAPVLKMMAAVKKGGQLQSLTALKSSHEALERASNLINQAVVKANEGNQSTEELARLFDETENELKRVAEHIDAEVSAIASNQTQEVTWDQDYANSYITRVQGQDPRIAYILSSYFNPLLYCDHKGGNLLLGYFISGGLGVHRSHCASTNGNRYRGFSGDLMVGAGVGGAVGYSGADSCGYGERPEGIMDSEMGIGLTIGVGGHSSSNSGKESGTKAETGGGSLGLYFGLFGRWRFNDVNRVVNLKDENEYALAMFVEPDVTDRQLLREFTRDSRSKACPVDEIVVNQENRLGQREDLREGFVESYLNTERRRVPTATR